MDPLIWIAIGFVLLLILCLGIKKEESDKWSFGTKALVVMAIVFIVYEIVK